MKATQAVQVFRPCRWRRGGASSRGTMVSVTSGLPAALSFQPVEFRLRRRGQLLLVGQPEHLRNDGVFRVFLMSHQGVEQWPDLVGLRQPPRTWKRWRRNSAAFVVFASTTNCSILWAFTVSQSGSCLSRCRRTRPRSESSTPSSRCCGPPGGRRRCSVLLHPADRLRYPTGPATAGGCRRPPSPPTSPGAPAPPDRACRHAPTAAAAPSGTRKGSRRGRQANRRQLGVALLTEVSPPSLSSTPSSESGTPGRARSPSYPDRPESTGSGRASRCSKSRRSAPSAG